MRRRVHPRGEDRSFASRKTGNATRRTRLRDATPTRRYSAAMILPAAE